jgi:hypothetical protein
MTVTRRIGNPLARGFDQAANSLAMSDLLLTLSGRALIIR